MCHCRALNKLCFSLFERAQEGEALTVESCVAKLRGGEENRYASRNSFGPVVYFYKEGRRGVKGIYCGRGDRTKR